MFRVHCSVELVRLAHGALHIQRPHILPVLLEQGDQEVDGQVDVTDQLVLSHLDVANSHSQTQDLWGGNVGSKVMHHNYVAKPKSFLNVQVFFRVHFECSEPVLWLLAMDDAMQAFNLQVDYCLYGVD